jgi:hypothetical protein
LGFSIVVGAVGQHAAPCAANEKILAGEKSTPCGDTIGDTI